MAVLVLCPTGYLRIDALLGGRESFVRKLDQMFTASEQTRGRNQLDISGMVGQYAQGNEPSHHVAYLYDYAGAPWRMQETVRRIVDSLYTAEPDGLCGNDDCGQMSAWYVLSAMGFYPVTPGMPIYAIGSPLFERVTLRLEGGRQFVIRSVSNSKGNLYIQSATLNGDSHPQTYLKHDDILRGGSIEFVMGPQPNKQWGSGIGDAPPALPAEAIIAAPVVQAPSSVFSDSIEISLTCTTLGATICYSVAKGTSVPAYQKYMGPIRQNESCSVFAYAEKEGSLRSKTVRATFNKFMPPGRITLNARYSPQYTGGGDEGLIDGKRGNTDFRLGAWQGYEGNDLDAVIDLGSIKSVQRVALGCLQDNNSWIFFPKNVEFSFSADGLTFGQAVTVDNNVSPKEEEVQIKEFSSEPAAVSARYVRVRAKNLGVCQEWHKGAGSKAWLFVDEIALMTK